MPSRVRYWWVEKYFDGALRDVAGPWRSYNAAHRYAADMRHIHGVRGWSYAVTNRRPRVLS